MVRKVLIITFMLLLFVSTNVYAGDTPEVIMTGRQKALFIGKITDINTDTYSIVPSTIMMGYIHQPEIKVQRFEKYYGTNNKPKTGDFIVAVLLDENKIDNQWVFKSTTDDYKTLNLVSIQHDIVVRYEKYINEGKYFEAQKKIDENKKVTIDATNVRVDDTEIAENNKVQSVLTNKQVIQVLTLIVAGIVFLTIFKFNKRHSN
jgi:hypothetical protein